jgi:hypothetical protein
MSETEDSRPGRSAGDPAAASIALGHPLDPRAAAYLEEQTRLARLQAENLLEQNAFELSHLWWQRFNDQMKGALQIMAVALGLLIVAAVATAMWKASEADGIVIESFSVPPAFADAGTTGAAVADDLNGKIGAIRDFTNRHSLAVSKDVRQNRDDIRVEIPETGISLTQAWQYLRAWLGHERHLSGFIRALPDGRIAFAVSLDGSTVASFEGKPGELDALEQKAAEQVFAAGNPTNYVLYLAGSNRPADALAAAAHNVAAFAHKPGAGDTYSLWSGITLDMLGDPKLALARARIAEAMVPKEAPAHMEIIRIAELTGDPELALAEARIAEVLRVEDTPVWRDGIGVQYVIQLGGFVREEATGDFQAALDRPCTYSCTVPEGEARRVEYAARLHDVAGAESRLAAVQVMATPAAAGAPLYPDRLARMRTFVALARGDWRAAAAAARAYDDAIAHGPPSAASTAPLRRRTAAMPLLAEALAMQGDVAGAHAAIDATPRDCYDCLRTRGIVEARARNWAAAEDWLARAVALGPSIPFAYLDWGRMRLAKGDRDGAIAKFALAHAKGPRFADPLEAWGEALVATNRSDLALAKFAEAARTAPNWGRLHLKWGEALLWSGDKPGAARQFAAAAALYLTPSERAELARLPK